MACRLRCDRTLVLDGLQLKLPMLTLGFLLRKRALGLEGLQLKLPITDPMLSMAVLLRKGVRGRRAYDSPC